MATEQMNRAQLVQIIRETSGAQVAEAVEAAVARAVQPMQAQQAQWGATFARVFPDGGGAAGPQREKGLAFGRCVRATALAHLTKQPPEAAVGILEKWGDHDLAELWRDARTKAMAAGDATAGGFLVPTQFSMEVIEFLRAAAVVRRMRARVMPVPTGTLKIPKLTGGATAYYVGENTAATKSELTTGQLTLSFKKLITLVPMSNDLVRYSSPGADAIVRDDTVNAMRVREDAAFIRDTGSDSTPKGLRYWVHANNVVAANGTVSVVNVYSDLGKLIRKLLEANMPMIAPGWLMAPRIEVFLRTLINSNGFPVFRQEMDAGTLLGYPFANTTSIPVNLDASGAGSNDESEIYLVDFAQVLIGESMSLLVDASQEAAYTDGSSVVSAYDRDQTVIRAIAEHDLGLRHDKAVAVLTECDWAPGSV